MAKKNDWVRIHRNVLTADQRTGKLPEDTKQVPFEMWVKGHLMNDAAEIGDKVTVTTIVGREEHGTLIEVNPCYTLNYGEFVPEILTIDKQLRAKLFGGN
jgi:hypothetical protein